MKRKVFVVFLLALFVSGCQKSVTKFYVKTYPEGSSVEMENWETIATTRITERPGNIWARGKHTIFSLEIDSNTGAQLLNYEQNYQSGSIAFLNSNWTSKNEFIVKISHADDGGFDTEIEFVFQNF